MANKGEREATAARVEMHQNPISKSYTRGCRSVRKLSLLGTFPCDDNTAATSACTPTINCYTESSYTTFKLRLTLPKTAY
jgi:hypothetical protein